MCGLVELGLSAYDFYDVYQTFSNPCSDQSDRWVTGLGLAAGALLPGGGYGKAAKYSSKHAKVFITANPKFLKFHKKDVMDIHHRIPKMYYEKGYLKGDPNRLSNLYALPKKIHQKRVNKHWTQFRKNNPYPTPKEIMRQAILLDREFAKYINRIGR